jgi:hypothetical protein
MMYPRRISPAFGKLKSSVNKKSIGCPVAPLPEPVVLLVKMYCLSISPDKPAFFFDYTGFEFIDNMRSRVLIKFICKRIAGNLLSGSTEKTRFLA